ncbi:MAG: glutamine--fructose-6-phosphate transaminase (isomerizing) [Symbiobacteriaceae bacterium]|nr:glutamine--fructose-6-phosphate transaminase (isomerizing) [Symbiobacteriaceae bacterium]
MCGIIGYVGAKDAVPLILDGLWRLEYRGYDSAGVAVHSSQGFLVRKKKGRLQDLQAFIDADPLAGNIGIGHTRWATHGEPSDLNSHPHLSSQGRVAVVHNGIIENYLQLKEELEDKGVVFTTQTDSEVVAHLAEGIYQGDPLKMATQLMDLLTGSYALAIMIHDNPHQLIAISKDSPLKVGKSEHGMVLASDIPALLPYTNHIYAMEKYEVAILTASTVSFYNRDGEEIAKVAEETSWTVDSVGMGGYPHYMLKEIMEQPAVIQATHSAFTQGDNAKVLQTIDPALYNKLLIVACGSSYNAGSVGKSVFETLARLPMEVDFASEFRYKNPIIDKHSLVILISQSGETADTIAALREAKELGAKTIAIVNVPSSTIAKEADYRLLIHAGPEIAVATTKAFSAQLIALYHLALDFAVKLGRITREAGEALVAELALLPEKVAELLNNLEDIQRNAYTNATSKNIFFIGRFIDYAISLEGSLKLKEISYIHSEAYAGGELKHGTISLVEDGTLVVAVANCPSLWPKIMNNVEQVLARGARVLVVGQCQDTLPKGAITQIFLPETNELFSPSLSVVALQLFSYYVAATKGLDIDKPRNLAKSVTVE